MQLNAEKREHFGKNTKKLRRARQVPGVVFGKGLDSLAVQLKESSFMKVFKEAGETNVIDLKVSGEVHKVLVKGVQTHPVSSSLLHVDFHEVNLKEKITANIPVEVIGEETNGLLKNGEAVLLVIFSELEVEALPTDLPNAFIVDVSKLTEVGDAITIADLDYDKSKVEIQGYEEDELVAKLDYPESEEEETEASEEELIEKLEVTGETAEDTTEEAE